MAGSQNPLMGDLDLLEFISIYTFVNETRKIYHGYHQVLFHLINRALKWLSGLRMARRSPGGGRSRGPVVVGGEETLARHGSESLFCKKVKVSLYTFYFCFVNCCKTGQIYAVHRVKAAAEVAFDNEMQIN